MRRKSLPSTIISKRFSPCDLNQHHPYLPSGIPHSFFSYPETVTGCHSTLSQQRPKNTPSRTMDWPPFLCKQTLELHIDPMITTNTIHALHVRDSMQGFFHPPRSAAGYGVQSKTIDLNLVVASDGYILINRGPHERMHIA